MKYSLKTLVIVLICTDCFSSLVEGRTVINPAIYFKPKSAQIQKVSYPTLDESISILKTNPEIKKIQIEGHTDSNGSDADNMKLSIRRANAVKDYFIRHGIDPSRLEVVGYGELRPMTNNATEEGRAQNRRVVYYSLD